MTVEKISLSKIECEDWLGELLSKYRKKHNLDTWKDTLHGLVRELLEKAEKPAEALPSDTLPKATEGNHSDAPLLLPQQAQPPSNVLSTKRSFIRDGFGQATLAYEKEKARQKARTEAILERAKQKEEFRKQVIADRHEREYSEWKRRQIEKQHYQRPKKAHVDFPNSGGTTDADYSSEPFYD